MRVWHLARVLRLPAGHLNKTPDISGFIFFTRHPCSEIMRARLRSAIPRMHEALDTKSFYISNTELSFKAIYIQLICPFCAETDKDNFGMKICDKSF